ncbi:hypothetical protein H6A15_09155 [Enorma phocaeensis]|nr:hypothetical protein [Enorma phocaeensis]MBM6953833.1 hypothetical protein [Enorma phocaeensis]
MVDAFHGAPLPEDGAGGGLRACGNAFQRRVFIRVGFMQIFQRARVHFTKLKRLTGKTMANLGVCHRSTSGVAIYLHKTEANDLYGAVFDVVLVLEGFVGGMFFSGEPAVALEGIAQNPFHLAVCAAHLVVCPALDSLPYYGIDA